MSVSTSLQRPFERRGLNLPVACELLRSFARFEAALKYCGYARQQGTMLLVRRRRFAEEHEHLFSPFHLELDVQYLISRPPKRQTFSESTLAWVSISRPPQPITFTWLFDAAYQVRNNLFHGGKSPSLFAEPARDTRLMRGALGVLQIAIGLNSEVADRYEHDEF